MKILRFTGLAVGAFALTMLAQTSGASALPLAAKPTNPGIATTANAELVHYRRGHRHWGHRHWGWGGPRYYNYGGYYPRYRTYGYYGGPGISLFIGPRWGHRWHHRRHW